MPFPFVKTHGQHVFFEKYQPLICNSKLVISLTTNSSTSVSSTFCPTSTFRSFLEVWVKSTVARRALTASSARSGLFTRKIKKSKNAFNFSFSLIIKKRGDAINWITFISENDKWNITKNQKLENSVIKFSSTSMYFYLFAFLIVIHSIQDWIDTARHGVMRKWRRKESSLHRNKERVHRNNEKGTSQSVQMSIFNKNIYKTDLD